MDTGNTGLIDLDALVEESRTLDPLPASALRLAGLFSNESWALNDITDVVRFDEALTGRLLGVANSAAYGARLTITNVDQAVVRLGPGVVLSLAIGPAARSRMQVAVPEYGLSEGELWRHSVASAVTIELSRKHCKKPVEPFAFAAALLHDIGKLVLARHVDGEALELLREARSRSYMTIHEAEEEVLRVSHSEVGALVARAWKLPEVIVQGIQHHHSPLCGWDRETRRLCHQIALADAVTACIDVNPNDDRSEQRFDGALAGSLGITREGFDALCVEVAERLDEVLASYD